MSLPIASAIKGRDVCRNTPMLFFESFTLLIVLFTLSSVLVFDPWPTIESS